MADVSVPTVVTLFTIVSTFLTTMLTLLIQSWNRGRERRWDQEDRERLHKEQLDAAAALGKRVEEGTSLARQAAAGADKAYTEANNINLKIAALGSKLVDLKDVRRAALVMPLATVAPSLLNLDPLSMDRHPAPATDPAPESDPQPASKP